MHEFRTKQDKLASKREKEKPPLSGIFHNHLFGHGVFLHDMRASYGCKSDRARFFKEKSLGVRNESKWGHF